MEPTQVSNAGPTESLTTRLAALRPGYKIDADLQWDTDPPQIQDCRVTDHTLFAFRRGVTGLFEVALDTWEEAHRENQGINSRVTYSNDGIPNGALYTFAEQRGERDLFTEFRTGRRPLEPLLDQIDTDPPYEVFIFDPQTHPFVLVYIVLHKGSVLADTVRDTYNCPRPSEPLTDSPATQSTSSPEQTDHDNTAIDLWDLSTEDS